MSFRFLDCQEFYAWNRGKPISIETAPVDEVLLIKFLTEKLSLAVKQGYGIEYHRIGEDMFPTWILRTYKIQASMQKLKKKFLVDHL